jgi:hypothetical protein
MRRSAKVAWVLAGGVAFVPALGGCELIVGAGSLREQGAVDGGGTGGPLDGSSSSSDGFSPGTDGSQTQPDGTTVVPGTDSGATSDAGVGASVLQYHLNASRDGHYVDPLMTQTAAAGLKIDTTFAGDLTVPAGGVVGTVWNQPLYVENGVNAKGTFYVADDADNVFALDETTGAIVWSKVIDTPATTYGSGCGNDPGGGTGPGMYIGITGTPVIDLPSRTMYLVAVHAVGSAMPIDTYKIHALSIDTGVELTSPAGWPLDVSTITSAGGVKFNPQPQIERGALALFNGSLYVPFGGEDGDCGDYHGWVVSVPTANPSGATGYTTGTTQAGIWAVGGLASDGIDIFAATANGGGTTWAGNEAILRFANGSTFSGATTDFFAPSNWTYLDQQDLDLGGTGPVVVNIAGTTPSSLILAYGKSGVVHVLDRTNLGGIAAGATGMAVTTGQGVYSAQPTTTQIRNGPVAYTTGGITYTAFQADCSGGDLLALKFATSGTPSYTQAWCANAASPGSPMVTTTDATGSNPIVWMSGGSLTGWDGATGVKVFGGGAIALQNVSMWTTPIDVKGRIFVGTGTQLYALTTQ